MNGPYSNQRFNLGALAPNITWAVRWIILVNAAVFAGQLALAPLEVATGGTERVLETFGFSAGPLFHGMLWQPLSYQFLHLGLMHLFMNMLWLFFFGPEVERLLGSRQFIRFYLGCGALAVLVPLLPLALLGFEPIMCGASGSVMGVMVAFAMIDPRRQFVLFPLPVPISAVGMVVLVLVMNVVAGINGDKAQMITHLGGMAAGYGLMKAIPWYYQWRREQAREKLKRTRDGDDAPGKVGEAVDNIFKFKDRK
jgi:membrane associated rhomboid family serine protease